MPKVRFEKDVTGLIVIDPYNDFISEGGKVWDRIKSVAEANRYLRLIDQSSNSWCNAEPRATDQLDHSGL